MNELVLADRAADWCRLKALVLDSVSSPITRRVYNLGLNEFIAWYCSELRSFAGPPSPENPPFPLPASVVIVPPDTLRIL
jgi:hypothetical protein